MLFKAFKDRNIDKDILRMQYINSRLDLLNLLEDAPLTLEQATAILKAADILCEKYREMKE